jgi:hypothetical protein
MLMRRDLVGHTLKGPTNCFNRSESLQSPCARFNRHEKSRTSPGRRCIFQCSCRRHLVIFLENLQASFVRQRLQIGFPSRAPSCVPFPDFPQHRFRILIVSFSELTMFAIVHFDFSFFFYESPRILVVSSNTDRKRSQGTASALLPGS